MMEWFDEPATGREHGRCGLRVTGPRVVHSVDEAWELLPGSGDGWVALTDAVRRFEPGHREGLLLHAEVAEGPRTLVLRHEDGAWRAWVWEEREGDDHRVVRECYLSSAPDARTMEYATYWARVDDDGVGVWTPVGSRFCGFGGAP